MMSKSVEMKEREFANVGVKRLLHGWGDIF